MSTIVATFTACMVGMEEIITRECQLLEKEERTFLAASSRSEAKMTRAPECSRMSLASFMLVPSKRTTRGTGPRAQGLERKVSSVKGILLSAAERSTLEVENLDGIQNAHGDYVTSHDATKDVDKDGLDLD